LRDYEIGGITGVNLLAVEFSEVTPDLTVRGKEEEGFEVEIIQNRFKRSGEPPK